MTFEPDDLPPPTGEPVLPVAPPPYIPPQAQPQPQPQPADGAWYMRRPRYAPFKSRAMAFAIDAGSAAFVPIGIVFVAFLRAPQIAKMETVAGKTMPVLLADPAFMHRFELIAALVALVCWLIAVVWPIGRTGQTYGGRYAGVRVVDASDSEPIGLVRSLLRFAVSIASALAVGAGYFWVLYDGDRRAWHDIAASTVVVRDSAQ